VTLVFSITYVLTAALAILLRKYRLALLLTLVAVTNDLFSITVFGVSMNIELAITAITLFSIILFDSRKGIRIYPAMNFLYTEWLLLVVLGCLFGLVFPWTSPFDEGRSWSQLAGGRALVSTIRIFLQISLPIAIAYFIQKGRITLPEVIRTIAIVVIFNLVVAVIEYFSGNFLKMALFPDARIIESRFTGFCGESRAFGRNMAIAVIILYLSYKYNPRIRMHAIYLGVAVVSVLISLSASSLVALIVSLFAIAATNTTITRTHWRSGVFGSLVLLAVLFGWYHMTDDVDKELIAERFEIVYKGKPGDRMVGEPAIFTHAEVFDRAALNFLYHNPQHLLFGTGPNLISIPASPFLSPYAQIIYKDGINSVPHSGFVNVLARSGLVGLLLYSLFFKRLRSLAKTTNNRMMESLALGTFVFFMLIDFAMIYVIVGIILSNITGRVQHAKHYYPRT
jgi:hypothetical protein